MNTNIMKSIALVALSLVFAGPATFAQSSTWSGGGSNSEWLNVDNWVGGVAPIATDIAYFGEGSAYTVNRDSTSTSANQLIFTQNAGVYTFTGNAPFRLAGTGLQVANYSSETQTFSAGLFFGTANSVINAAKGDIVVENGIHGGSNRVPSKHGIGTLTINGTSDVGLQFSLHAGAVVLDAAASQTFGTTTVAFQSANTLSLEITGAASGVTTVTRGALTVQAGGGVATQVRLNSNGGDEVALVFNAGTNALSRFAPSTLNVDLSSHAGNSVSFASVNPSTATAMTAGIFRWGTVTDTVGTGLATMSGTNFVRNTTTTLFTGADATVNTTNYHVGNGATTLSASRSTGSLTIHAEDGGTLSGAFDFQTGALLVQEGTKDYAINSNFLSPSNGTLLHIHQYSTDGTLVLNGDIYNEKGSGVLIKSGPGAVEVSSSGRLRTTGITHVQGGALLVNGEIERSSEVRVFHTATLEGAGSLGTVAASAVRIYGGGTLAGGTAGALAINGTLALDSYSNFAMTLNYAATDYVDVSGVVTLQDEVNLVLTLAAAPVLDLSVVLLEGSAITGTFGSINGSQFGPGGTFSLDFDSVAYDFQISYSADQVLVQAIPEPATTLLVWIATAFLLFRRRRHT